MNTTVGFAHRRLAVIDLSDAAAQPLHYLHYTIIFNGEIYNYKELKETSEKKRLPVYYTIRYGNNSCCI